MSLPFTPWHLWGSSTLVTVRAPSATLVTSGQLARIAYKRPETWRFFVFGRLLNGTVPAGTATVIHVEWDVVTGVGRSSFSTENPIDPVAPAPVFSGLGHFVWSVPVGTPPGQQAENRKYATSVPGPVLDDVTAARGEFIDHLVAQDLQCAARIRLTGSDANAFAQIEVGAFFSPNVHIRPDWFANKFPVELGGT